ncbi:MAG TPA: cyclic nucleotide-binding domain-containing protein [Acidimicrobiia bacterium]|nr:cyclic nucleotide-binding domain-containing protein [Acidimicrobiia bacterium]
MLKRRSAKGGLGSSEGQAWTGAAEINYVEMSFARVPIFKACSRDELIRVARVTRIREHLDGDDIIQEGAKGRDFFVLLEGTARVTRGGQAVASLERGDFFGELALFDPAPRNATVTAVGKVRLAVLTQPEFHEVLKEETIRDSILAGMARRLHELDSRAVE